MTPEIIGIASTVALAIVATWVKLNADIARMNARIHTLEKNEVEVKTLLKEMSEAIRRIELHLAKHQ
jgi:chaperonin cofactor prefoldin